MLIWVGRRHAFVELVLLITGQGKVLKGYLGANRQPGYFGRPRALRIRTPTRRRSRLDFYKLYYNAGGTNTSSSS
jgi:hypothetical protein